MIAPWLPGTAGTVGGIGTLRTLRITSRDPEPPPRSYLDASGGIFRDMTIHYLGVEPVKADEEDARVDCGEFAEVLGKARAAVAGKHGVGGRLALRGQQVTGTAEPRQVAEPHDLAPFRLAEGQDP